MKTQEQTKAANELKNIIVDIKQHFTTFLSDLKDCDNNDYILFYPKTGLGIDFAEDGKPFCTSVLKAKTIVPEKNNMPEEAWAYTPIVKNGAGEQASIMPRQQAIRLDIARVEEINDLCKAEYGTNYTERKIDFGELKIIDTINAGAGLGDLIHRVHKSKGEIIQRNGKAFIMPQEEK